MRITWIDDPKLRVPGVPRKYYHTETAFQIYVATWLRKQGIRHHHSANERQGARSGFSAKLKGQSKGFPDLLVFGLIEPVALELKVGTNKLSEHQIEWLDCLSSMGWAAHVCYTFEEVKTIIQGLK